MATTNIPNNNSTANSNSLINKDYDSIKQDLVNFPMPQ